MEDIEVAIIPQSPDEVADDDGINDENLPDNDFVQDADGKLELIVHNRGENLDETIQRSTTPSTNHSITQLSGKCRRIKNTK